MIHDMKLKDQPFRSISNGTKRVEMRLNDEKRQKIKNKDYILFTNIDTKEQMKVQVTKLQSFPDFNSLYLSYSKVELGYNIEDKCNPDDMLAYYSLEEIKKYGVLAIELIKL